MSRFLMGLAVVAMLAVGVFVFTGGGGTANAAPIPGGSIDVVCAGALSGTTYTLSADCGDVTGPITVPSTITTVNGAGHTLSATDIGSSQFNGAILTNASAGQTMNIENLTVSGPAGGFQICTLAGNVLFGIRFNDASGSVNNVTVEHIWQQPNLSGAPSCNAGTAIRVDNPSAARAVTITNTTVLDYQKNGIDGRGVGMTMDVSGSSIGPPNNQEGLIAANGLVYVGGATGTAMNSTIRGSGDQQLPGPPGGGTDATAVLLFGARNVTITHNTITGAKTDIGVAVSAASTGNIISFNTITRTEPDVPDPTGHGIDVFTPDGSGATPICNTFSNWNTNIVGAEQISCTPLPNGTECQAYSASAPAVDSGKNYDQTDPNPIIDATPFTWTVASGTLPPGLSLSSAGAITGTPTAAGTFNFTMKVVDSTGLTATQAQTITIARDCAPPPTTTTTATTTTAPPPTTTTTTTTTTPTPPAPPSIPTLVLRKVSNRHVVHGGDTIQFTITTRAVGKGKATNLHVCDRLPPGFVFVRAPGATLSGGRACWRIPSISAGHSRRFHVVVRSRSVQLATVRTNVATVVAPKTDCTARRASRPASRSEAASLSRCRATATVLVRRRAPAPPPVVTG
jgi:uncharacterized repeat protein (TIGR01451 family)